MASLKFFKQRCHKNSIFVTMIFVFCNTRALFLAQVLVLTGFEVLMVFTKNDDSNRKEQLLLKISL